MASRPNPPSKKSSSAAKLVSMRLADPGAPRTRRALVLGVGGAADLIAQELRAEGFETETAGEPLPPLSDTQALDRLRGILTRFSERTRNSADADALSLPVVHPGVSVWAERPELATLGKELGLDVITPPARVLALFANKLNFLGEAERLGIPHLALSFDPMYGVREIERLVFNQALARKSFPIVLKAVKGGGSFGLFVAQEASDLERKIPLWMDQLRRSLGEVTLFAEKYLEGARHIVVPFVRYQDGRFLTFPMTDASLQSRHRKVIEFCPATGISEEVQRQLQEWTQKLADHIDYVGLGTLEFLVDDSRAFLIEGSARLNTGFHLWERVAGTSAVAWQLSALQGGKKGSEPRFKPSPEWATGVALRLYAEDSLLQLPQPGMVHEVLEKREWRSDNPQLRIAAELDLQVRAGTVIRPSDYGMVGMLWAGAADRKQAMIVARGVLDELWISGALQTNERFLAELLAHPWVKEGIFHAGFVDEEFLPAARPPVEILRVFPAILMGLIPNPGPGITSRWAVGDQWVKAEAPCEGGAVSWVRAPFVWTAVGGSAAQELPGVSGFVKLLDGRTLRVCAYPISENRWQVRVGAWVLLVRRVMMTVGEKPKRLPRLFALVHGQVHSILFREGSTVPAHEPLLILDSLGMLVPHALPVDVRVIRWKKNPEEIVHAGEELAEFDPLARN